MKTVLVAIFASIAVPAMAQNSLGITGSTFDLGVVQDELGESRVEGGATVDVAISDVHGFQGDLRFADTAAGGVGTVAAHLYMAPRAGQKYGLFASVSDIDGRAMTWGSVGAEGMISLSFETTLEGQAGIGFASDGGLDYIFASAGVSHAYSPTLEIEATLDLAEFDEPSLRAISYEAGVKATYSPEGAPWGVYASLSHAGLSGRDGQNGETRLGLGLTMTFGNSGSVTPNSRPFRSVDPVAPLLRRNLW